MWFTNSADVLKALTAPLDSYVAFDVQKWQHQVVPAASMASVVAGLLPEEEVRKVIA